MLYKAARLAGFDKISFELEPIGAAAFYHRSAERRQRALIFDFGGGTLDVAVVLVESGEERPKLKVPSPMI